MVLLHEDLFRRTALQEPSYKSCLTRTTLWKALYELLHEIRFMRTTLQELPHAFNRSVLWEPPYKNRFKRTGSRVLSYENCFETKHLNQICFYQLDHSALLIIKTKIEQTLIACNKQWIFYLPWASVSTVFVLSSPCSLCCYWLPPEPIRWQQRQLEDVSVSKVGGANPACPINHLFSRNDSWQVNSAEVNSETSKVQKSRIRQHLFWLGLSVTSSRLPSQQCLHYSAPDIISGVFMTWFTLKLSAVMF